MNPLGRRLVMLGIWFLWALAGIPLLAEVAIASQSQDFTEMSLEELINLPVVGASKYAQKLSEAPADVSIVTREEIKKYGYRTLADILKSVRSFYVRYDRIYSYLGVRGFSRPGDYNSRILLLIDGIRINDNVYDQAPIGTEFPLDIDLIERVEIIRGPGSSLYGSNAFFAVINIITRRGRDVKGVELSGDVGSLNTFKGRATYGNRWPNGLEALVSGTFYDSHGNRNLYYQAYDKPASNQGLAVNCDADRVYGLFSKLAYKDFSFTGFYNCREKQDPTGAWGTVFNDPRNRQIDAYAFLDLKYEHTFKNGLGMLARLTYNHYRCRGDYLYNYAAFPKWPFLVKSISMGLGDWWGGEVQVTKKLWDRHRLVAGVEYRHNLKQHQSTYDEIPYYSYLNDTRSSHILAGYLQDEFILRPNFRLNAGVRYDYYSTFGGTCNPRVALIYQPFEKTTLKALYGQAFRAPNVYELYYRDGGISQKANPKLKPEKIQTYELLWEQSLNKNLKLTTTAFYYRINDLINTVTDPADGLIVVRNTGKVAAKGVEMELAGRWVNRLEGRLSYSLQEARDLDTGRLLSNSPRHLVKLNLTGPLYKDKLFGGLEVQYTSPVLTISGRKVSGFSVTNFTLLSKNVSKNWEFSASVYNLFNQKYGNPGGEEHLMNTIYQDGIGFRVKALFRF